MATTSVKDKFLALVSDTPSGWLEKAKWHQENEAWLDKSFMIALRVIKTLREKGMSQKDLAAQMGVSPQQVSKILKGTAQHLPPASTAPSGARWRTIREREPCIDTSPKNYGAPII